MLRFSFAQHDRVEEVARPLDAHHAATALIDVVHLAPDLQRLGLQFDGQRLAQQVGLVEDDHAVL